MRSRTNYRQIWSRIYGPIPKDDEGRPYDIHHIDGDTTNNNIENLQCVSLQEHYNIHYNQGNFGACYGISLRLKIPEDQRLLLIKITSNKRIGIPRPDMISDLNPMRNPEIALRLSLQTKNKPKSEQGRKAIGIAQRKRLLNRITCNHCNNEYDELNYKRWHGDNCKRKII